MLKIERVDNSWEDDYGGHHSSILYTLKDTDSNVNPLHTSRDSSSGCVTYAINLADKVYDEPKDYSIFRYKESYYKAVYRPWPKITLLYKEDIENWLLSSAKDHGDKISALTLEFEKEQKLLFKVLKKMSK